MIINKKSSLFLVFFAESKEKRQPNNRIKALLLIIVFGLLRIMPLASEIVFTPQALADPEGVKLVMDSWRALAEADPQGTVAAWLKKPGESGYIGDITVDFDTPFLNSGGMRAAYDNQKRLLILQNRLPEPFLSGVIAHEAGGHAYYDVMVPFIDRILPPRYAVATAMIREINGFLNEAIAAVRLEDRYTITETITSKPPIETNPIMYLYKLRKYIADTRPGLSEAAVWEAACNEFAMGFTAHEPYLEFAIEDLPLQFYELMYVDNQYYTPPVFNRASSHYMANLDYIMQKYLEAAMPPGVKLTIDTGVFLRELSGNIDLVDKKRAVQNKKTCAWVDSIFKKTMDQVASLGGLVRDGGMAIGSDVIMWLDAMVGSPNPNPNVLANLRSTRLYRNF